MTATTAKPFIVEASPYIIAVDSREQRKYEFVDPLGVETDLFADLHQELSTRRMHDLRRRAMSRPRSHRLKIPRRHQAYTFANPLTVSRLRRTFTIRTQQVGLQSGDYSLVGFENQVAIERKSLSDLFNTLGSGRARFQREFIRLSTYSFAAVVVEAEWSTISLAPPERSQLPPRTVMSTVVSWQQTYPNVHWWFVPGRAAGEQVTLRMLDKWWRVTRLRVESEKPMAATEAKQP